MSRRVDDVHSCAGLRGHAHDHHAGANGLDAVDSRRRVEFHGRGEVHFRDDGDVGGVEDRRVFQRLVLAFGDRDQDQAEVFAQIVGGRADEIADVFDEQEIQLVEVPVFQGASEPLRLPGDRAFRW